VVALLLLALILPATPQLSVPPPSLSEGISQVIIATKVSQSRVEVQRWEQSEGSWRKVGSVIQARSSPKAFVPIDRRVRNTGTTPTGIFALTSAFGFVDNPGTTLPYRRATPRSWWVADPRSPLDDTWQECAGNCSWRESEGERLRDRWESYRLAVVVETPSPNASAIFLHLDTGRPLSGCLAFSQPDLLRIMRWLKPAANPHIVIQGR
jgi:L,D-peptidoglycan transpeptidase YkuD (ErfK/YbiS/YcfS/YnhG family)